MIESTLVMVKVLCSIVLALDIDDDVAFLQDFRVAGAGDGRILVRWGEAQEEHGERFVSMEGATTRRVMIWIVYVLPVCSDPSRCRLHLGRQNLDLFTAVALLFSNPRGRDA